MRVLSVFEHDEVPVVRRDVSQRAGIPENVSATLRAMVPSLPRGAIQFGDSSVRFSQHCGVLVIGDVVIEILPKIYRTSLVKDRATVMRMLAVSEELAAYSAPALGLESDSDTLLDMFVHWFCDEVRTQFRQGVLRQYVRRVEPLAAIRGRVAIVENMRRGPIPRERLWCDFDEHDLDNPYNRALKAALARLIRAVRGRPRLMSRLSELDVALAGVALVSMTGSDVRALPRNRIVARYAKVLRLCEMILDASLPSLEAGGDIGLTLLFDMNKLFQSYLEAAISSAVWQEPCLRSVRASFELPQLALMTLDDSTKGVKEEIFRLKPDICLSDEKSGDVVAVMDAKWKLLSDDRGDKFAMAEHDVYQVVAYRTRYGAKTCGLLYPWHEGMRDRLLISFRLLDVSRAEAVPFNVVLLDLDAELVDIGKAALQPFLQ